MESGVYKITCIINNKIYIGSAQNLSNRSYNHFSKLRCNRHSNKELQNDFNNYGEENFIYEIIEVLKLDDNILIDRENYWIDNFNSINNGYNYKYASRLKKETRKKIKKSNSNFKHTEETKKKISKKTSGENNGFYGKTHSEEVKKKLSESRKGKANNLKNTLEECIYVKQLLLKGMSATEIKLKTGINGSTISRIKNNKHFYSKLISERIDIND